MVFLYLIIWWERRSQGMWEQLGSKIMILANCFSSGCSEMENTLSISCWFLYGRLSSTANWQAMVRVDNKNKVFIILLFAVSLYWASGRSSKRGNPSFLTTPVFQYKILITKYWKGNLVQVTMKIKYIHYFRYVDYFY